MYFVYFLVFFFSQSVLSQIYLSVSMSTNKHNTTPSDKFQWIQISAELTRWLLTISIYQISGKQFSRVLIGSRNSEYPWIFTVLRTKRKMARHFTKVSEEEIEEVFFYPSDLVNTKTTILLRVGEEQWIYTSTLRVSAYIHHYSPPLRGIVVYYSQLFTTIHTIRYSGLPDTPHVVSVSLFRLNSSRRETITFVLAFVWYNVHNDWYGILVNAYFQAWSISRQTPVTHQFWPRSAIFKLFRFLQKNKRGFVSLSLRFLGLSLRGLRFQY